MKKTTIVLSILCFSLLLSCQSDRSEKRQAASDANQNKNLNQTPGLGYEFENNGKDHDAPLLKESYTKTDLKGIRPPKSNELSEAIAGTERYLKRKKRTHQLSDELTVSDLQIKKTIKAVKKWQAEGGDLGDFVEFHQMDGEDNRGNMHFTGYYIPVLQVSKKKTDIYKYPLYRKPKSWNGKKPTREDIDNKKALAGKGLEICYSSSLLEIYTMQVQGSGVVEYRNGDQKLLSFGGKNGYAYKSLGKYLVAEGLVPADKISLDAIRKWAAENPNDLQKTLNQNESYVFFKENSGKPSGAAGVPLVAQHSVAVDKSLIPLGSVMLGKVPVLNSEGVLVRHDYRILFAHDVGGAIKKGHIDFFSGTGLAGENIANALHHYGEVWLLLAKD